MTVNFAGARSVDDRRRRRISQTTDVSSVPVKQSRQNQRGLIPKSLVRSPELLPESPIHALIPKTPWKFWTLLGLVFLLWAVCATAGICNELTPQMHDWGLSRFFNMQNGTFWNCWTISCLMISAQLSWITYWYRSHGTDDFQGHYKTWLWTAAACSIVAFLMSTEIGYIIAEQFGRKVHLYNQQMTGLIWLAALYAVGYELSRKIDQELGECRSAFIFMVLFVASSLVGGWLLLMKEPRLLELHQHAWLTLAHSLVSFFLLATIFCFTRRTLYITAEAAERRKSPVFNFVYNVPQLSKIAVVRSIASLQFCVAWLFSLFNRGSIEEDATTIKKPKRVAKKSNSKVKRPAGTKKRKLKETLEDDVEEEYAEDEVQEETEDYDSEAETSGEVEDEESEEETKETFDEEAWLQKEIEREAKLKKQAELERLEQQKQESNKQKFRLDTSHQQSSKPQQKYEEEREEEEYSSNNQKHEQESYSSQSDEDEDNQNSDGNGGYDPELFKGLSKREKRKLKQQLREQERQQGKRS